MTVGRALNTLAGNLMREFDYIILGRDFETNASIGEGLPPDRYYDSSEDALQRIDAKAGALLTHISMMIAAATFMIAGDSSSFIEKFVIGADVVAYIFLALTCIRCLLYRDLLRDHRGGVDAYFKEYQQLIRSDVVRSGMLLNFALRWAFFITFLFMISAIVHVTM